MMDAAIPQLKAFQIVVLTHFFFGRPYFILFSDVPIPRQDTTLYINGDPACI